MSDDILRMRGSSYDTLVSWQRTLNHILSQSEADADSLRGRLEGLEEAMEQEAGQPATSCPEPVVMACTSSTSIAHTADTLVICRNTAAITLTFSAPLTGRRLSVTALSAAVTIRGSGPLKISGEASFTLMGGESLSMVANAEGWWVI